MTFITAYVLVIFAFREGAVSIPGYETLKECDVARLEVVRQAGEGAYAYCIPGPSR